MAENVPIPWAIMSYRSGSKPWNAQRLVNWYPETAPQEAQAKTPVMLLPRQGLAPFATAGSGPVRGEKAFLGVLYVVSGDTLYSIDEGGTATSLGTISGVGPVTMDTNTTQLCIVARPNAWIYTPATATLTQITDPDFPGSGGVTQVDGYFIHMAPDNSGEFFLSDLNDGLAFDALDFATAETDSDPMVRPFVDHRELFLCGEKTIEVWFNSGAADFPFARTSTAAIEKGLIAAHAIAKFDNTLAFVANDKIVYRLNGYQPQRISTHAIEKVIADTPTPSDIVAFSHVERGHTFFVMTSQSGDWTLAYDAATGLWADRSSYPSGRWTPTTVAECYNKTLVGSSVDGSVYELQTGLYTDDGDTIRFELYSAPLSNNTAPLVMSRLEVCMESGVGLPSGQGSDPQAMLRWSDDGGRLWSNEHWRSIGAVGDYKRKTVWRRLGQFTERTFNLVVTDPVKPVVLGAYADVS